MMVNINTQSIKEGSMSDIDIIAQEAKDFKDFVKEFYKEYTDFAKTKESLKWLEGIYKNRSKMEGLERVASGLPQTKEEPISENTLSDLEKKLKSHDWWYAYSDDNRKYTNGRANWFEITKMIRVMKGNKEVEKLWNKYVPKDFNYSFKELSETQINEETITEKQLKGLEGIPSNVSLDKISKVDKLKIIKAPGNIITFFVPDWAKGSRNFWQVIGTGKIKKNMSGEFGLEGKGPVKSSPTFKTMDALIDGVDWKSMEQTRRFNESLVNEEKSPEEILMGLKQMAMTDLERIGDYAEMIADRMEADQELSSWMYSKITLAVDQLNSVHDTMDGTDGIKEAELPKAMIPGPIKAKLTMAINKIKDTNLSYPQKLQVIAKIIDSLGIDKKELVKISSRLKGTLESVHEDCGCGCGGVTEGGCGTSLSEGQLNEWKAEEVLQQLGGRKFIAMTGAKNFVKNDKDKSITFKIPRAKDGITHVMITLNSSDTYTVNFLSIRGNNIKQKPIKGVYNDQLQSIFTKYTGLYTSL